MQIGAVLFWCFLFMATGVGVGALIQYLMDKRTIKDLKESKQPVMTNTSTALLAKEGDLEILRAWRTQAGKLWLEMDNTRLEDKAALQVEQKRRLLNLVIDLRPWLDAAPAADAQPAQSAEKAFVVRLEKKPIQGQVQPPAAPAVPALKSMIQQIDEVLQTKLETTTFRDRGIALTEGISGEVIVLDGPKRYTGIEAVPDPEVQALIRQAVSEWEQTAK